jgi:putative autoinducer-2 (AI-2) aldolase
MGRNIFQSAHPAAMIQAVSKVVHDGAAPSEAYDWFQELSRDTLAVPA